MEIEVVERENRNADMLEPEQLLLTEVPVLTGHINLRTVIHNIPLTTSQDKTVAKVEAEKFSRSFMEPKFIVSQYSILEGKWMPNTLSVEAILHMQHVTNFDQARETFEKEWFENECSRPSHNLWVEPDLGPPKEDSLVSAQHRIAVFQMSLGTFPSPDTFNSHWQSHCTVSQRNAPNFSLGQRDSRIENLTNSFANQRLNNASIYTDFEHDMKTLCVKYTDESDATWKLEISYNRLEKLILVSRNGSTTDQCWYFFTTSQPKVFKKISKRQSYGDQEQIDQEQRVVHFASCSQEVLGSSNVISLTVSQDEPHLEHIKSRLTMLGFTFLLANPIVVRFKTNPFVVRWPSFKTFDASFAWFSLLSKGFKVTDQINDSFLSSLKSVIDNPKIDAILNLVLNAIDRSFLCDLKETFLSECENMEQRGFEADKNEDLQMPHIVKVRRILLTPTTVRGLGEEWTVENRVIRQFGADRFIRIAIRDEEFQLLSPTATIDGPVSSVIKFLTDGLIINERHYKFLGCSNSQLRQHGVWMYASDGLHTVDSIRKWMGDLSEERCVATYVARLGQCFSSSKDSIGVDNVDRIHDIENGEYCFTDGIGKISLSLGKLVSESLRMNCVPSAFQVRFGGSKGVVALAPDLGDEEKMQLRESMVKFESKHNRLEVMQTTKPGVLHLNKQVILLMSGLKVPDESFFYLQETMLKKLADMLVFEEHAIKALSQSNLGIQAEVLTKSGIVVTTEPFLRAVLTSIYQKRFMDLLRRTRIEIPSDKGRIMMGTVDETGKLEYGQVFVQYSKDVNKQQVNKMVLEGRVVIAKNPCFHPGDLRKFEAVDIPELHHMVDCVVFPSKGPRPHPNEMSGSDLDGDMYFVCWLTSLVPPGENQEPMDFTPQRKVYLNHPVRRKDMINFIGNYIASDQVGVIANAHLVHADAEGIFSENCLKLAQLHSDAIDFPKTGKCLRIPSELRPGSYPHYMMKHEKPMYTSNHLLARLFDHCQAVEQSSSPKSLLPIHIDEGLLFPGYDKYLESARLLGAFYEQHIGELMTVYGIESEASLLSVTLLNIQERKGYLKGDHFEIAEIVRLRLQSVKQKLRKMFFEEFKKEDVHKTDVSKNDDIDESEQSYEANSSDVHGEISNCPLRTEVWKKASAVYYNTYAGAQQETEGSRRNIGLPWIFADLLIEIRKNMTEKMAIQSQWSSCLHKMSVDMIKIAENIEKEIQENREKRLSISKQLLEKLSDTNLVLFGSTISTFDSSVSGLDLYVSGNILFQETVSLVRDSTGGIVSKSFLENPNKKVASVMVENDYSVNISLYSSKDCLQRTAFIIAATILNRWLTPVLRVALEWARNNNLVADAKETSLKAEEFIIMFYHVVLNVHKRGCAVSEDAQREVTQLLEQNHFLTCPLCVCEHLEVRSYTEESQSDPSSGMNPDDSSGSNRSTSTQSQDGSQSNAFENPAKLGEVLLQFFRHFGTVRGKLENCVLDIPDPSSDNCSSKLIHKKPQQCQQIVKKMMQAHHSLANSSGISEFLNMGYSTEGPFSTVLPVQFSSSIKYRKAHIAEKIKASTGAEIVTIREKKFRDDLRMCMILEAWGSASALLKVREKVRDMVASSSMFVSDLVPVSKPEIADAYHVLFEHCQDPEARIIMVPYDGPNQPGHDTLHKNLPRVWQPDWNDELDENQFVSLFNKQREFIVGSYDKILNGELRGVISYGTYYICNCKEPGMTATEFQVMISKKPNDYAAHIFPTQSRQGRRGSNRGSYSSHSSYDKTKYIRRAFIPTDSAKIEGLKQLLKSYNFVRKSRRIEYRPTIRMSMSGRGGVDGILVLNENFIFQSFILPDEKWFVLDTVRDKTGINCHVKDMRFKIHSRPIYRDDELTKYPELDNIIKNADSLLLRSRQTNEVYGVRREFMDRIKFLRRKDVQEFEYNGKGAAENTKEFLFRITIRVNFGKEFSRPNLNGTFRSVSECRTEVTVVPKLPDLQDAEESEQFMRQLWQFSQEFGGLLTD